MCALTSLKYFFVDNIFNKSTIYIPTKHNFSRSLIAECLQCWLSMAIVCGSKLLHGILFYFSLGKITQGWKALPFYLTYKYTCDRLGKVR